MLHFLVCLVLGFFFSEFAGYALHRFLHSKAAGFLNRAHLKHHDELYPPTDFFSREYRSAGWFSTVVPFAVAGVGLGIASFVFLPWWVYISLALNLILVGYINDYVHGATHLTDHWLEKYPYFQVLRRKHQVHHENVKINYGIFTFLADRVFRTNSD